MDFLVGFGISLGTVVVVALGVICGVGIWALRGKSRLAGALVGLGVGLLAALAMAWLGSGRSARCDYGDPADLPVLPHPAGYVYVIQDVEFSGLYKIGRTNHPARRLPEIRNLLPGRIRDCRHCRHAGRPRSRMAIASALCREPKTRGMVRAQRRASPRNLQDLRAFRHAPACDSALLGCSYWRCHRRGRGLVCRRH